jgi:hypothetical protein
MSRWRQLRAWDEWASDTPHLAEPPLALRRRLAREAKDGKRAVAIERSDSPAQLERAAKSLKHACAESRVLHVPYWNLAKAEAAMRRAGVTGSVRNLCGSQSKRVKKR